LDAGIAKDRFTRDDGEGLLQHPVIPCIAIMPRIVDQRAVGAEQGEVNAPRIDPDPVERNLPLPPADSKRMPDLMKQSQRVPIETGGQPNWSIGEPVQLFERQLPTVERSQH